MTCGEAALEELQQVNLTAGGCECEEVEVVNVDVAVEVSLAVLGVEDVHMIELLSALGTVFEHCSHSGVAVDVGVLALDVVVLGSLEGEILVNLHQLRVHIADSRAVCAVEDVLLGGSGVSVFDKDLFYSILNGFSTVGSVLRFFRECRRPAPRACSAVS